MRPLPVHEQRNLSVLWGVDPAVGAGRVPVPYGAFKGFADASPKTLSAVAGVDYHGAGTLPVREQGEGVNMRVALVTGNLFDLLGVTPLLGRNIRAEDDSVAAAPVVAISYDLWQRRFGANPAVLGRVLTIRGQAATIVAVMPRGFGFPARTEVWATARPFRPVAETGPPDFYVYLVGRLAPGATVEQSASELTNYLESNLAALPMLLRGMTASAETFDDDLLGDVRPVILLLLVASALVMLVAIVNAGALFLALELTRRQELAVRVALGATARRLLLLALGDALIVAAAAAVLGVAIAHGVVRVVVAFASTQLPRSGNRPGRDDTLLRLGCIGQLDRQHPFPQHRGTEPTSSPSRRRAPRTNRTAGRDSGRGTKCPAPGRAPRAAPPRRPPSSRSMSSRTNTGLRTPTHRNSSTIRPDGPERSPCSALAPATAAGHPCARPPERRRDQPRQSADAGRIDQSEQRRRGVLLRQAHDDVVVQSLYDRAVRRMSAVEDRPGPRQADRRLAPRRPGQAQEAPNGRSAVGQTLTVGDGRYDGATAGAASHMSTCADGNPNSAGMTAWCGSSGPRWSRVWR